MGSQCDLNWGLDYIAVLDTFIFASGFFDSCGVEPVGSIVTFPGSIFTPVNYVQNDPNSPKVEIINGQVVVDRGLNQLNDDIRLAIYDVQGRLILKQNCCSINI
ncbi:MAG: hypothetical protein IPM91_04710 [Bacteroidetes bacterium]|nr:hypothetical protein [Bacteroidota bacterium]